MVKPTQEVAGSSRLGQAGEKSRYEQRLVKIHTSPKSDGIRHRAHDERRRARRERSPILRELTIALAAALLAALIVIVVETRRDQWLQNFALETEQQRQVDLDRRENVRFVRQVSLQFPGEPKPLQGLDLAEVDLRGINLESADLRLSSFAGANLTEAKLVGAVLSGVDMHGTNLAGADLSGVNPASTADRFGFSIVEVQYEELFEDAITEFRYKISEALAAAGDASESVDAPRKADLEPLPDEVLREIAGEMRRGRYLGGLLDLTDADLTLANLKGADLSEADLSGATLTGVCYDPKTTWPTGYNAPPNTGCLAWQDAGESG